MKFKNIIQIELYAYNLLQQKVTYKGKKLKSLSSWGVLADGEFQKLKTDYHKAFKIAECFPDSKMIILNVEALEKLLNKPKVIDKIVKSQIARAIQYERYGTLSNSKYHIAIMKKVFKFKRIETSNKIWKIKDISNK